MKKLLISIGIILVTCFLYSFTIQENHKPIYKIIQKDTKFSKEFCEKAISEANWCGFRYENKRNIIQFDTGLKVEFYSMNETADTNPNCVLTDYRDFSNDIWKITEEGKIVHKMSIQSKR